MKLSKSVTMTTVLLTAIFTGSSAFAENVSGYRLDPAYNIRSQPNQESQRFSTIGRVEGEVLKVKEIPGNAKWLRIERANGGEGYVHKNALKPVELNGTYVIRSNPSLTSGSRLGSTADVKRPSDLILTGQAKVVKEENGKTVQWLEVVAKGKKGWVAGGVTKNISAPSKTVDKPVAPKADKPAAKPAAKPEQKPESKPPVKPVVKADEKKVEKKDVKKIEVKPVPVKPETKPETKPAAKEETKAEPQKKDPQPEAKANGKNSDIVKQKPVPVELPAEKKSEQKPETKVAPGAKPKKEDTAKPAAESGPECVRTKAEYEAATRLKKIYGEKYDPFVKWDGGMGASLTPDGKGVFDSDTTALGWIRGLPRHIYIPTQICADMKTGKPYLLMYNKKQFFTDKTLNEITLSNDKGSNTYRRSGIAQ